MRDIRDFLYRYFDDVALHKGGQDLRVNCPFCISNVGSDDVKQHLYVNTANEVCHCFRCNYSNNWVGLVMDVADMDYVQALGELYVVPSPARFDDIDKLWTLKQRKQDIRCVKLPEDFIPLHHPCTHNLVLNACSYLYKRGFIEPHWTKYGLGVAESIGYRVIIPIEDEYWQARALYPFIEPKYINPEAESKHVLFNNVALKMYDEVVICEGAFSAMAVGDNAIALVGKSITPEKLRRLTGSKVKHFIITIEKGADDSMMTLADALHALGKKVTIWKYNEGDPADSVDYDESEYGFGTKVSMLLGKLGKKH